LKTLQQIMQLSANLLSHLITHGFTVC